jgi:cell division protein FtsB
MTPPFDPTTPHARPHVQDIPTPHMKKQTHLKRLFAKVTLLNGFLVFVLLVVLGVAYAVKVSVSSKLEAQTTAAKQLYEENMHLEVQLNQLRSYGNLDRKIKEVPNLISAKEKIQVASRLEDWDQPIILGKVQVNRQPEYEPMSGF